MLCGTMLARRPWGRGGTGIRACLRGTCRKAWRFKSSRPHHFPLAPPTVARIMFHNVSLSSIILSHKRLTLVLDVVYFVTVGLVREQPLALGTKDPRIIAQGQGILFGLVLIAALS